MIHKKVEMRCLHGFHRRAPFLVYFYSFKANQNVAAEFLHNSGLQASLFQVHIDAIRRSLHFCNCEEFQLCIIKNTARSLRLFSLKPKFCSCCLNTDNNIFLSFLLTKKKHRFSLTLVQHTLCYAGSK